MTEIYTTLIILADTYSEYTPKGWGWGLHPITPRVYPRYMKNTIGLLEEFCMNHARENKREIERIGEKMLKIYFSLLLSTSLYFSLKIHFQNHSYKNRSLSGFSPNIF